ncbi:MAG: sigma-70 family RNA polymerase sigma factor [Planctomycetes bacterium]|nr:sigma-70 family RNA polymerase sigma factor [Planctomycetota bacterium]
MDEAESELFRRWRAGDRSAFGRLFSLHANAMYQSALSVAGSSEEARDVVQETYVRLAGRLADWRGEGSLVAWFATVSRRLAIDRRRRKGALPLPAEGASSRDEGPEAAAAGLEEGEILRRAVDALPPLQRETVRLRYFAGLSLAEVAAVRGTALGTVKATLHQAIEKLRREMGDQSNG